jgi:lipase chaperone LimK
MTDLKSQWNLEMALEVVQQQTVTSEDWAEAVKWLLLYGPPEIQELLRQASSLATRNCFPELRANGYTDDGEACYDIRALAAILGLTEEETVEQILELERQQGRTQLFSEDAINKVQ